MLLKLIQLNKSHYDLFIIPISIKKYLNINIFFIHKYIYIYIYIYICRISETS